MLPVNREAVKKVEFAEELEVKSLEQPLAFLNDDLRTKLLDDFESVVIRILSIHKQPTNRVRSDVEVPKDYDIMVRLGLLHDGVEKLVHLQKLDVLKVRIPKEMSIVDSNQFPGVDLIA